MCPPGETYNFLTNQCEAPVNPTPPPAPPPPSPADRVVASPGTASGKGFVDFKVSPIQGAFNRTVLSFLLTLNGRQQMFHKVVQQGSGDVTYTFDKVANQQLMPFDTLKFIVYESSSATGGSYTIIANRTVVIPGSTSSSSVSTTNSSSGGYA